MEKILYLECNSGISGDMMLGMLLDLGADRKVLEHVIESMGLTGYRLCFGRTKKCGIDAFDFNVQLIDKQKEHRNIKDVYDIIDRADTGDKVKILAKKIFRIIAEAEAEAHGIPVEQVHFHEVGAIDSIIDIVGTAVCLDNLGIRKTVVSKLIEGVGTVTCQHGILPVPVPATLNIITKYQIPIGIIEQDGEMITPTGAGIVAALRNEEKLPSEFQILRTGIGAGIKSFAHANILRGMIVEKQAKKEDTMWIIESNIDDTTGEMLGFVMEMLFQEGAADVWYTPVYMKKNRPAYKVSVMCEESIRKKMEDCLFQHTTTIGVRRYSVERTILKRKEVFADTQYGKVQVKICSQGTNIFYYPEYESVRKICKEQNQEFMKVYMEAIRKAEEQEMK